MTDLPRFTTVPCSTPDPQFSKTRRSRNARFCRRSNPTELQRNQYARLIGPFHILLFCHGRREGKASRKDRPTTQKAPCLHLEGRRFGMPRIDFLPHVLLPSSSQQRPCHINERLGGRAHTRLSCQCDFWASTGSTDASFVPSVWSDQVFRPSRFFSRSHGRSSRCRSRQSLFFFWEAG